MEALVETVDRVDGAEEGTRRCEGEGGGGGGGGGGGEEWAAVMGVC